MAITRKYVLGLAAIAGLGVGLAVPAAAVASPVPVSVITAETTAPEGVEDSEVSTFAASGITYGGKITRAKVIERAKYWYSINVPYSQSGYHYDKNRGKKYRTDCSGFVSMSWALKSSRTTRTLGAVSTRISWKNMKAGDMVLKPSSHVMLFHKWANSSKTAFYIYEEGSTASDMNYRKVKVSSASSSGYSPWKYKNIK